MEVARVQTYLSLSKTLFQNLFETELKLVSESHIQKKLGIFLGKWGMFERELIEKAKEFELPDHRPGALLFYKADKPEKMLWEDTRKFRNIAVHKLETLEAKDFDKPISNIDKLRESVKKYT